jgi:hypothetical protein
MKRVILLGTGNLGKRYLQAILNTAGEFTCYCYDINPEALDNIDEFLIKNNIQTKSLIKYYGLDEILAVINNQSLVIVATTANGRLDLVSRIIDKNPEVMIIEKPVTQTRDDYLILKDLIKARKIPAFTHYNLRFQPFCKDLQGIVDTSKTFEMISVLPIMGLACVSIHYIDLFLWLFNIKNPSLTQCYFYGSYEQKRKGFYDMFGEIIIRIPGRGVGRFINSEVNGIRQLNIILEDQVISIYEDQRVMTFLNKKDNKSITTSGIEYYFASQYLIKIIRNYLSGDINRSGELVSLEEAYLSHGIIFDFMEKTGNKKLNIT